jgi:hypothetical protein
MTSQCRLVIYFLGARAGHRYSLFACPAGQTKELKQALCPWRREANEKWLGFSFIVNTMASTYY